MPIKLRENMNLTITQTQVLIEAIHMYGIHSVQTYREGNFFQEKRKEKKQTKNRSTTT
jgi:hypothetical protein